MLSVISLVWVWGPVTAKMKLTSAVPSMEEIRNGFGLHVEDNTFVRPVK